jgi:hypothetical protein
VVRWIPQSWAREAIAGEELESPKTGKTMEMKRSIITKAKKP